MKQLQQLQSIFQTNGLRAFAIVLLILGIFFRFYNLDYKIYWNDETLSSLRSSGSTATSMMAEIYNSQPITVGEILQRYQHSAPDTTLPQVLNALADHPEHSPLYYVLLHYWAKWIPSPVLAGRGLAALMGLLIFPTVFWLCRELFGDTRVGWAAIALMAISPMQVQYAQEARQYTLWIVATFLSSTALLRALRFRTWTSWGLYAATVALSGYTHLFAGLVWLAQAVYVVALRFGSGARGQNSKTTGDQNSGQTEVPTAETLGNGLPSLSFLSRPEGKVDNQTVLGFMGASLVGVLAFTPWLWVVVTHFDRLQEATDWVTSDRDGLVIYWLLNLNRVFFDMNQGTGLWNPLLYLNAILTGYALYQVGQRTPRRISFFIWSLVGTGFVLVLADILLGGRRSSIARYLIPCYLGVQLAVAYVLTLPGSVTLPESITIGRVVVPLKPERLWRSIFALVTLCGVLSCLVSAHVQVWWHKSPTKHRYNPEVAEIINRSPQALVITDELPGRVLSLCYLLKPTVTLALVVEGMVPEIPEGYRDRFLYKPSDALYEGLVQQQYRLVDQYRNKKWLWKVLDDSAL